MTPPEHTDDAYLALAETTGHADPRWAFGTGIVEQEGAELGSPVSAGTDPAALVTYCLMLADDALVLQHRLSEWVANAPELEEEVALANVALDLLGQARVLLGRAGHLTGSDEDSLAYLREPAEFRNVRLVEPSDERDFAHCVARLLVFATWRLALLQELTGSADPVLAAVAAKGVKEVAYHREYAAGWVVRLGDGTEYSHGRMQAGLDAVWPYVDELFRPTIEARLPGIAVDPAGLRAEVDAVLDQVLAAAGLTRPGQATARGLGREGVHTELLGPLLDELQGLARRFPGATW